MLRDVLSPIKGILNVKTISTDNIIFKLHYKLTVFILLAASLLVTQKQYFGDPIDCITNAELQGSIDSYCWIVSTFTIQGRTDGIAAGVGPHNPKEDEIAYHSYYQWVTLFLYLQAVCFYIPRYVWRAWEKGKIKMLVNDIYFPIMDENDKEERLKVLVNYFVNNRGRFTVWGLKFVFCEILNFINIILQLFLTDWFVGFKFTSLGPSVVEFLPQNLPFRHDPLERAFPKLSKCSLTNYGPSGSKQLSDALCVLPLNIFNEKIFIFLWFWFIILAVITFFGLLYRMATFLNIFRQILFKAQSRNCSPFDAHLVSRNLDWGDWIFLYQCGKNIDPFIYNDFIHKLGKEC